MATLPNITPDLIRKYQEELIGHFSPATVKRKSISIGKFLDWAKSEGIVDTNLGDLLSAQKQKERKISAKPAGKIRLYNWYNRYRSIPGVNYLNIAIALILTSLVGLGIYNQFFKNATSPFALTALNRPNRYLSFQGRLTNQFGNPITTATGVVFKLYDNSSGGSTLWNSGSCSVSPDIDGVFSILLGNGCGTELTSSVFSDNAAVWLGVTVAADAEAIPRVQIATVAYALNSETLQGYPASSSATINTVPVLNNSGQMVIAAGSPKIQSTSGTFAIEGQVLTISTPTSSNGSITIAPDGTGSANFNFSGAAPGGSAGGFVNATDANLTSKSLYYGAVASNATGYNLLQLQAGATPANRFVVDAVGNATASGTINGLAVSGGTITGGTWHGGVVPIQYGGTGANNSSATQYAIPYYDSTTTMGGILGAGTEGNILTTHNNSGPPTWTSPSSLGTNYWALGLGTIYPGNTTMDLLIGNSATASAKFAFINVLKNTPTASISGSTAGVATFIDGNGNISSTLRNSITIGNSSTYNTTGNVLLNPNGFGNIGIGTSSPFSKLSVVAPSANATGKAAFLVDQYESQDILTASASGSTRLTLSNDGTLNLYNASSSISNLSGNITITPASGLLVVTGSASASGDLTLAGGSRSVQTTASNLLTIGGTTTGNIVLAPLNNVLGGNVSPGSTDKTDLGTSSSLEFRNIYGQKLYQGVNQVCDSSGSGCTNYWQLTGGVSLSPANNLYALNIGNTASTSASTTFHVPGITNNNAWFNLGTGNVGVGVTAPTAKLYVQGASTGYEPSGTNFAILGTEGRTLGTGTGINYGVIGTARGTGDVAGDKAYAGWFKAGAQNLSSTIVGLHVEVNSAAASGTLAEFVNSSTTKVIIDAAGSVGIGTTSPLAILHAAGANQALNSKGNVYVSSTDAYAIDKGGQISIGGIYSSGGVSTPFAGLAGRKENASDGNAAGYMQFLTSNSSGGALTEKMRITNAGNVGIGTTSPSQLLDVNGNFNLTGYATMSASLNVGSGNALAGIGNVSYSNALLPGGVAGASGYLLTSAAGGVNTWSDPATLGTNYWQLTGGVSLSPANSTYAFNVGNTASTSAYFHVPGTNNADAWFNLGTGRVGIGTTAPTSTLDVAGAASVSGSLTFRTAGSPTIQTTAFNPLVIGGNSTGNITLDPSNHIAGGYVAPNTTNVSDLGTSSLLWRNIYATSFYQGAGNNAVCDSSGNCAAATDLWSVAAGAIYPKNSSVDLLIGSTATSSAKFAFTGVNTGGTPTASIAGSAAGYATYLTGNGVLSTTKAQDLTLGGTSTGNVIINSRGSTALTANGANLTTGAGYLYFNGTTYSIDSSGNAILNAGTIQGNTTLGDATGDSLTIWPNTWTLSNSTPNLDLKNATVNALSFESTLMSLDTNNSRVGIGTTAPTSTLDVAGAASVSGSLTFRTAGSPTIQTTAFNPLVIGGNSTGNITLDPSNHIAGGYVAPNTTNVSDLGTSSLLWRNIYGTNIKGTTIYQGANQVCDAGGTGCPAGATIWGQSLGSIYPLNNTVNVFFGATAATATTSAKFAFTGIPTGGTPTASIAGTTAGVATFIDGNGNISTTNRNNLVLGNSSTYDTTGNILLNPVASLGNVGIGTTAPTAKLEILAAIGYGAGLITTTNDSSQTAITGNALSTLGSNIGVLGVAKGNSNVYGVEGNAQGSATNYGVYGTATGGTTNWAGYFTNGNVFIQGWLGIGGVPGVNLDVYGNASVSGLLFHAGASSIQTNTFSPLTIGGTTTGNIVLAPSNNITGGNVSPGITDRTDLGTSSSLEFRNIYAQKLYQGVNQVCDAGGGVSGCSGINYWQLANHVLAPANSSDYDLAVGGNSTASARFQVFAATGNASMSGTLTIANGQAIQSAYGPLTLNYKSGSNTWSPGLTIADVTGAVKIAASVAPTTDVFTVSNTGYPVTTAGSSAIQLTYVAGSGAIEASAERIDLTSNTVGSGSTWNGYRMVGFTPTSGVSENAIKIDGITAGAGTGYAVNIGTGWSYGIYSQTASNNYFAGNVGIGTTSPTAPLDVAGAASVSGTLAFRAGTGTIQTTVFNPLVIGGNSTGNITLDPSNHIAGGYVAANTTNVSDLGTSSLLWRNIYGTNIKGTTIYQGANQVCDAGGGVSGCSGINYWQLANHVLAPANSSDYDLAVGGNSTASARFQVFAATGDASMSGSLTIGYGNGIQPAYGPLTLRYKSGSNSFVAGLTLTDINGYVGIGTTTPSVALDVNGNASVSGTLAFRAGTGYIQTTAFSPLTIGGNNTGNIILSPSTNAGNVVPGANNAIDLGTSSSLEFRNIYAQKLYQGVNQVCDAGGGVSGCGGTNYWQLTGGVSLSPANNLYALNIGNTASTSASTTFHVPGITNNNAWFNLGTGDLGIGTTSPTTSLQVRPLGSSASGYYWPFAVGNTDTGGTYLRMGRSADTSGVNAIQSIAAEGSVFGDLVLNPTGGNIGIGTTPVSRLDILGLVGVSPFNVASSSGGSLLNVASTGNIGIGTTAPVYKLQVEAGSALAARITTSSSIALRLTEGTYFNNVDFGVNSSGDLGITGGKVGIGINNPASKLDVLGTAGVSPLNVASSSGTSILNVAATGNVGIGTTNPSFPLSLGTTLGNKIALYDAGSGTGYGFGIQSSLLQEFAYDSSGDISFGYGSSSSFTRNVTFKGTGNVGIGTTSPTALLDVAGNASVSGTLAFRAGTGTIQTTVFNPLVIGGNSTGNITLDPSNHIAGGYVAANTTNVSDLGTSSLLWRNIYGTNIKGTTIYQGANQVCDAGGGVSGCSGINYWQLANHVLAPANSSDYDLAVGGNSTASARFQVFAATGDASMSGTLTVGYGDAIRSQYGPLTLAYKSGSNTWAAGLTVSDVTGQIKVATSAVPTADMVNIANTGYGVTSAGVSGIQISYVAGSGAIEASAERIDLTSNTVGSGSTWNGYRMVGFTPTSGVSENAIKIDGITAGAGTGYAVNIGTGWSYGIYSQTASNNYFAGNVGIGTTSPTAPLDVAGNGLCLRNPGL